MGGSTVFFRVRTKQRDDNIQIIEYFKLTANNAVTHLFGTNMDSFRGFIFAREKPGGRGLNWGINVCARNTGAISYSVAMKMN